MQWVCKNFCRWCWVFFEDAGRSEISFMKEVMDAVISAGARTINLPDTVGYRLPTELGAMVKELSEFAGNRAIISVHNHNDLGLATAKYFSCCSKWS